MKTEFQRIYPKVTVEFVRLSSGEASTRLRNERANPQFDIWWGGPIDSFIAAKQEGLLEAYDSPNMANLIDPKLMKDPDNYWAGIYVGSLGFASNKHFLEKHKLQPPNHGMICSTLPSRTNSSWPIPLAPARPIPRSSPSCSLKARTRAGTTGSSSIACLAVHQIRRGAHAARRSGGGGGRRRLLP